MGKTALGTNIAFNCAIKYQEEKDEFENKKETFQKLKLEDFKLFNSKSNKNFSSKKFVLNSLVPGYCLFEIDEILSIKS